MCAALLCSTAVQAANVQISDPVAFVKSIYALEKAGRLPPENINTPRLAALYALDRREAGGEVGRMEFDIWTNAQDFKITDVQVTGVPVAGVASREVVIAKLKNFGKVQETHFYFEKIGKTWMLDDARGMTPPDTWTLSLLLKYGWDGRN
jgi:hypothetical protein